MMSINDVQQAEPETSPAPTRRRQSPPVSEASSADDDIDGEAEDSTQAGNQEQMVKKLVRLALASEYSRLPIRRTDISAKGAYPQSLNIFGFPWLSVKSIY